MRRALPILLLVLLAAALQGCASASSPPPATPVPAAPCPIPSPATAPPPAPVGEPVAALAATPAPAEASPHAPPARSPAFTKAMDAAQKALHEAMYIEVDKALDVAATATGDDPHLVFAVAYTRTTRFAVVGDFERAAASLRAAIPTLAKHPELGDEFWAHNAMMMVREAQGDPVAALSENDEATLCAARGTWDPDNRAKLALDKDRWHRAYLLRMLAQSRTGSAREAFVAYAKRALADYRAQGGYGEAIAVLEAYFAALDGDKAAAVTAAKQIDPTKDGDLEDLYLVVVGLEAGGAHADAEVVRAVMRRPAEPSIPRAIMLHWLDLDAKGSRVGGFTPWHAGAR